MSSLNNLFAWFDEKIGPDKEAHKPACHESREMILQCVLESECYKVLILQTLYNKNLLET